MAVFNAYVSLDFLNLDFNWYARNFYDLEFYDELFWNLNGVVYQDALSVNGYDPFYGDDYGLDLLGSGISFGSAGEIVSGQLSALGEFVWGGDYTWLAEGISLSAVDVYGVALTLDTSDDLGLIASMLSGADFIDLSDDGDRVSGFDGNDRIFGRSGDDHLYGGLGEDEIHGQDGFDIIFGEDGNDWLDGGAGDDSLTGGIGDDWLRGGTGHDLVTGDTGADVFAFFVGDGVMTITDFEPGQDDLALGNLPVGFTVFDLLPYVSQVGDDVVIKSGDQEVQFQDTLLSELSVGDVVFV
jgi:Ca2+-binding RTX toxin-like protein